MMPKTAAVEVGGRKRRRTTEFTEEEGEDKEVDLGVEKRKV